MLNPADVNDVISRLQYKDWGIDWLWSADGGYNVSIRFKRVDSITGEPGESMQMRKWYVENWRDKEYLVHTVFKAIMSAEQHECQEFFKLDGQAVFSPHRKIEGL